MPQVLSLTPGAWNRAPSRRTSTFVPSGKTVSRCAETITRGPAGSPGYDAWFAELVSYRSGLAQNVVVLSLLGRRLDNPCGAQVNSRVLGFTHRFGANGFVGDICAPRYDTFFEEALGVIESACRGFVAPP